jgi:hypothetical protein
MAFARRTANDVDALARGPELISQIDLFIRAIYAAVNKVNRRFFGDELTVDGDGTKWTRPVEATAILWVVSAGPLGSGADQQVTTAGTRVRIVPFTDREHETAPCIYPFGRYFYSPGRVGIVPPIRSDPSASLNGDKLKFFFAMRHPALAPLSAADHASNTLHASWREHYNNMIVAKLARYLAIKGGRAGPEVTLLDEEYTALEALLLAEAAADSDAISQRVEGE